MRRVRLIVAAVAAAVALSAVGYYVYVRHISMNFGVVVERKVYRSAQPGAGDLESWVPRYGIRTIVNLRGDTASRTYADEAEAARRLGVRLITIELPNLELPEAALLMRLADLLETAQRPLLLHCREGADRTGLASVMARMAVAGEPYDAAEEQMSLRYLHLDNNPAHIAGVLRQYEDYCRANRTGTGGWTEFRQWLFNVYNTAYYYVEIAGPARLQAKPGETVRLEVRVVNRSPRAVPAGDPGKGVALVAVSGSPKKGAAPGGFCPPQPLPGADLAPGGEVVVTLALRAPSEPGRYVVHFDLVENGPVYFSSRGAAPALCDLEVRP